MSEQHDKEKGQMNRREFLLSGTMVVAGASMLAGCFGAGVGSGTGTGTGTGSGSGSGSGTGSGSGSGSGSGPGF